MKEVVAGVARMDAVERARSAERAALGRNSAVDIFEMYQRSGQILQASIVN